MKKYYIELIGADKRYERTLEADILSWSDAGLYEFSKLNTQGDREVVAYYPVNRTIISKIESIQNEKD